MTLRDVYLKIEPIPGYSPVEPDDHVSPPIRYRRDCMRNIGHEDGTIPADEVNARRLTALIYREYLDPHYLVPKPDKLVAADINEPAFIRRVPGNVIYARPGDRLRIHVKNADFVPHSFHIHGLRYGVDSDGAWPFHDHCRNIGVFINRGLFGGLVVLPEKEYECLPRFPLPEGFLQRVEKVLMELEGQARHLVRTTPAAVHRRPGPWARYYAGHGPDAYAAARQACARH